MRKDKEWLIKRVENYIPLNDKTVGHVVDNILDIIDQLDEPEVLSQEWIDEHAVAVAYDGIPDQTEIVYVDELENLIVPKQEKMIVSPQEDRFIKECKLKGYSLHAFVHCSEVSDENCERLTRAWLDGYEVEEESLYYALIKGHELSSDVLKYWNLAAYNLGHLLIGRKDPKARCINRMTKKNWNTFGINESNADFVEVDEELN